MLFDAPDFGVSPPNWPRCSDGPLPDTSQGFLAGQVRRRQTVERKAAFINQVMRGEVTDRSIDDVGDQALSYAEVKALATGNPLIMEKAGVEAELTKLERLQVAYRQEQAHLVRRVAASEREAAEQEALAAAYRSAASRAVDTRGDRFKMVVDGTTYLKRTDAAAAVQASVLSSFRRTYGPSSSVAIGNLSGFDVVAHITRDSLETSVRLCMDGIPRTTPSVSIAELRETPPLGLFTRLENLAGDLESRAAAASERADQARRDASRASSRIGQRFEHGERVAKLRTRLDEIEKELAPAPEPVEVEDSPVSPAAMVQALAGVQKAGLLSRVSRSTSQAAWGAEPQRDPGITL